jgi:hypothetical protein
MTSQGVTIMKLGNRRYNNQISQEETLMSEIQLREAMQEAKRQERKDGASRKRQPRDRNKGKGSRNIDADRRCVEGEEW